MGINKFNAEGYRYISENFTAYINEGEYAAGNKDFDYG